MNAKVIPCSIDNGKPNLANGKTHLYAVNYTEPSNRKYKLTFLELSVAELATHVQDNNSHDSDAIQETAAAEKESAKYTVSLPSIKMSEKMFSGILGSAKEFAEMQKALLKSIEPLGINVLDISRTTKMVEQIAKYLDANSAISTAALQAISQPIPSPS